MDADTSPFSRTGLFGGGAQDDVIPLRGWGGSPAQLTLRFCVGLMTSMLLSLLSLRVTKPGGGGAKDSGMLSGTASGKLARVVCRSLEGELADGPGLPQRESGVL